MLTNHKDLVHNDEVEYHNKVQWRLWDINIDHIFDQSMHICLDWLNNVSYTLLEWYIHRKDQQNPMDINKIHPLIDLIQYMSNHFDMEIENKMFLVLIHINDRWNQLDKDIDHQHPIIEYMILYQHIPINSSLHLHKPLFRQGFSWQNGTRFSQNSPMKPGSQRQIPEGGWTRIHVPLFWHGEWEQNVRLRKSCSQKGSVNSDGHEQRYPSLLTKIQFNQSTESRGEKDLLTIETCSSI